MKHKPWTTEDAIRMNEERKYKNPGVEAMLTDESRAKAVQVRTENAKKRKLFKETIDILLSKSLKKGELVIADDVLSLAEVEGKNVDVQTAILIAVTQRALMGDMTAVQFLRDTVGEKPSDKVEIDSSLSVETWAKKHRVKL